MSIMETTPQVKVAQAQYDFAIDGGAQGDIVLRPLDSLGNEIPDDAVVVGGFLDITTAMLSATGTAALKVQSAADLLAATAQAGLGIQILDLIPDMTGSTAIKLTAKRNLTLTIATADFTAGAFRVVVFYV